MKVASEILSNKKLNFFRPLRVLRNWAFSSKLDYLQ